MISASANAVYAKNNLKQNNARLKCLEWRLLSSLLSSLQRSFFFAVQPFNLHVCLNWPPQCPDVPLTKTCGPPSFYQLQEEGVLREDGLCEHLEEVPGNGKNSGDWMLHRFSLVFFLLCFTATFPSWAHMQERGKKMHSHLYTAFATLSPTCFSPWTLTPMRGPGASEYPGECRAVPESGACVLPPLSHVVSPPVMPQNRLKKSWQS